MSPCEPPADPAEITAIVSAAVRLYAAATQTHGENLAAIDGTVSPTDAVIVATALLKAHGLNPFDLAIWFSRTS